MFHNLSVRGLLQTARAALHASPTARLDAEVLLGHCLARSRAWLYAHGDDLADAADVADFAALVRRRADGEPVAYLTGHREFWNLDLNVSGATLIPRPDTEILVEAALARLRDVASPNVVDLGTGSGAIALALAGERPDARVLATDIDADTLAAARANAQRLGATNVRFAQGDWLRALADDTLFDLVVSNPPYIASGDPHLQSGDVRFEPPAALVSGPDGLDALRVIAASAPARLRPGGWLLLEHGADQAQAVRALLRQAALVQLQTIADLAGRPRVTLGRRATGASDR